MARKKYQSEGDRTDPQRFLQPLRTFFWVALITVLIWVYADMEFTQTDDLRATLRLNTAGSPDLVLLPPREYSVEFTVRGSRGGIERLQSKLQQENFVVNYDVSKHASQPRFVLSPVEVLTAALDLTAEGLTVAATTPQAINVETDELVTVHDIPIEFNYTGGRVRNVSVTPAATAIRVARTNWQETLRKLHERGEEPILSTRRVDLRQVEGDSVTAGIVNTIEGTEVRPETETVQVSFELVQIKDTHSFDVAVQVMSPPAWGHDGTWDEFVLERRDPVEWRKTITVTGPREDLDQLRRNPQQVQAYIVLSEQDKKPLDSWDQREVIVRFPPELNVELDGPPPTVWFRLSRREEPADSTQP
ncbi:MAG: hypothetical protein ACP5HU_08330 [Phycisphaerae bacterium]